jgi:GntR family transcriptional regulator
MKEQIETNTFSYGELFLSEKQLQEMFQVSRITIRQAMNAMVQAGYLECSRGIGTTVVFHKINETINQVKSFSEEMEQHGIAMKTTYCKITLEGLNKQAAIELMASESDQAYQLVRVRSADNVPMVYSITWLRKELNLPLDQNRYLTSLYGLLTKEYGIQIMKGQDTFEAMLANQNISDSLGIPLNAPVFKRSRKTMDQNNRVIEYTICYYPGDKYKYTVDL